MCAASPADLLPVAGCFLGYLQKTQEAANWVLVSSFQYPLKMVGPPTQTYRKVARQSACSDMSSLRARL